MTVLVERRVSYAEVLRVRQFQALIAAQLLSLIGDRAAAVALTVLVYERSQSPLLAAIIFGLTFVPHLFAAPLATLVDRMPRRGVLVFCDVIRVPLTLAMLIPGAPLSLLFVLLGLVTLFEVPFDAARAVVTRSVLDDDQYPVGLALSTAVYEASLLVGSIGGGLLITLLSVRGALLFNVLTFAASALILVLVLDQHPPLREDHDAEQSGLRETLRLLLAPRPRRMILLALLVAGTTTGAEGLAVSVAFQVDGGAPLTGLLAAAIPAGALIAGLLLPRLTTRSQQQRMAVPLVATSLAALMLCGFQTSGLTLLLLWVLMGAGSAVIIIVSPVVMQAVPDDHRGRAYGICSSALMASQGIGVLAAGALAGYLSPTITLALLGAAGAVALVPLAGPQQMAEGVT